MTSVFRKDLEAKILFDNVKKVTYDKTLQISYPTFVTYLGLNYARHRVFSEAEKNASVSHK